MALARGRVRRTHAVVDAARLSLAPASTMDPTARFTTLVQGPEPAIPLDHVALLVAAHARPGARHRPLDRPPRRDRGALLGPFVRAGSSIISSRPRSSPATTTTTTTRATRSSTRSIDRRLGIPITLGIVAIETGRRIGVPIVGIGMPGHFLVRDAHVARAATPIRSTAGCSTATAAARCSPRRKVPPTFSRRAARAGRDAGDRGPAARQPEGHLSGAARPPQPRLGARSCASEVPGRAARRTARAGVGARGRRPVHRSGRGARPARRARQASGRRRASSRIRLAAPRGCGQG